MTRSNSCVLLIDGGGSGARARLCSLSGDVLATGTAGPANISTDFEAAATNLLGLAHTVYTKAGRDIASFAQDYAFVALAGAGASAQRQELIDRFGFNKMVLATDIDVTLAAALGTVQDGLVAMLGTGSFFVWREQGKVRRVGGWGFILGDEAGGAWLGRELLRDTIKAYDGVAPSSALTQKTLDHFGGTPKKMVPFARDSKAADFAQFAPWVTNAISTDDPVAQRIVKRAVDHLCATLGPADQVPAQHLCFLGGLGRFYQSQMPADYQAICQPAKGEALDGAFWLAQQAFDL
ncbi:BadF/BadG/BcrA/BcrD ATPase family protein [Maritalea mediterranea]|uniref:N-acetylglucosamine kinase n=1 Tax=Maritalea mediterranea TaxID=2909667 RepID=A0ABS9E7H1_9HYPH|nr:BadF/BadG/BcrA/BcrD ATPase family protein [Maritalea mediterranea]MCF4097383.1 N-acetylglucosamine kinase [Maritalea mediterranea]